MLTEINEEETNVHDGVNDGVGEKGEREREEYASAIERAEEEERRGISKIKSSKKKKTHSAQGFRMVGGGGVLQCALLDLVRLVIAGLAPPRPRARPRWYFC